MPLKNLPLFIALLASLPALAQSALPPGCDVATAGTTAAARQPAFPPPQLEIRTPAEPLVFPSAGRHYLLYELHLHHFSDDTLPPRGLDIINADNDKAQLLAALDEAQLKPRLRLFGNGHSAVVFLCLAFDSAAAIPTTLRHRVLLDGAYADGPVIAVRTPALKILGRPLAGADWTADNGPSLHSHHRTGVFVAGGLAHNARRYAVDWKQYRDSQSYHGDPRDVRAHHAYGAEVLAVADATVVAARNDMPDNIPRTKDGFTPAVPITMDNIAGNFIVLALGDGQFAQYAHLQPGSVRVKAGDRVRRGQAVARVGNSGDARVPHLHFQVADNADFLAGEGLPYLIDQFRLRQADGQWQVRTRDFPADTAVIDFDTAPGLPL